MSLVALLVVMAVNRPCVGKEMSQERHVSLRREITHKHNDMTRCGHRMPHRDYDSRAYCWLLTVVHWKHYINNVKTQRRTHSMEKRWKMPHLRWKIDEHKEHVLCCVFYDINSIPFNLNGKPLGYCWDTVWNWNTISFKMKWRKTKEMND